MDLCNKILVSCKRTSNGIYTSALEAGGNLTQQRRVIQDPVILNNYCLRYTHYLQRRWFHHINVLLCIIDLSSVQLLALPKICFFVLSTLRDKLSLAIICLTRNSNVLVLSCVTRGGFSIFKILSTLWNYIWRQFKNQTGRFFLIHHCFLRNKESNVPHKVWTRFSEDFPLPINASVIPTYMQFFLTFDGVLGTIYC